MEHVPAYQAGMQPEAGFVRARPGQARPRRSLTAHHMFVPLVALWFGALFSLSSLAVRTGLFEQMVVSVGVDRLFPYASPPLGHTARLVIAAVFGLAGAGIGAALAKVVAGERAPGERPGDSFYPASGNGEDYRVRARDAHPDAPARRPVSASELGEADIASSRLEEEFPAKRVPAPWVPRVPMSDEHGEAEAEPEAEAEAETPALPDWFTDVPVTAEAAAAPEAPEPQMVEAAVEPSAPAPVVAGKAGELTDPDHPEAWRNTAERIAHAPPAALGHVELIERLAIALNKRGEDKPDGAEHPAERVHGEAIATRPVGPDAAATIQALRDALSNLRGS